MKYLLSFFLFLFALSLQSLQAATPVNATGDSLLDLFSLDPTILDSPNIIGIGLLAKHVPTPIGQLAGIARPAEAGQRQAALARALSASGRMGVRLTTVMGEVMASDNAATAVDDDPTLSGSTDIIADADANTDALQEGRMYTPKLKIDYKKFPIPTYSAMPEEVRQKRMDKLNGQIQKRFGKTVQVDYRENVHYLRGTVPSERQKEVLELFVKMEPGIQKVQNEIVIGR